MKKETLLEKIAQRCPEYEGIAVAQNYGSSILNNLESLEDKKCDLCVNWYEGDCDIFQEAEKKYI
ncbi:hypothetical protein [Halonatronum saccharophilum]|uniref:hypothetical protein n=1 Tax=Halonatronum saccharophilum TaxID=150060 RepID=UPI00048742A8|nr:hypothetical protein [Halonatronum saccharophilum]